MIFLRYGNIFFVADCNFLIKKSVLKLKIEKKEVETGPQIANFSLLEMHFIYLNICYFFNLQT